MHKQLYITFILLSITFATAAQEIKTITLKQQRVSFSPQHYHVTSVIDNRKDTTNIGTMRKGLANKETLINLDKGAKYALSEYINNNISQNQNTLPISIHIKELEIKEEKVNNKQQVNLHIGLAYFIGKNQLIEYTGTAYIQTGYDASAYIDKIIRSNIVSNLKEFDRWVSQNKKNIHTTPSVKVNVVFAKSSTNHDLIIYGDRKLRLDDFAGTPDELSLGAAATYSGITASYTFSQLGMTTTITALITPYFHKKKSWVKDEGYNTFVLSHEQLHFDITALKSCHLANKIKTFKFSSDNYSEELNMLLNDIDKEAEEMQNLYDKETLHGTLQNEQELWQKKINKLLAEQNYFKNY